MPTCSRNMRNMTLNRSHPVARAQRARLCQGSAPRVAGAAREIFLFLLIAVVLGGGVWYYLGSGDTEPSADLTQMMGQATESASEAADSAANAASSAADAASSAADVASDAVANAAETTEETIEAVGEEMQTETDAALGGVGEVTDSASQAAEQAPESNSESLGELADPAPDTSVNEVITGSTSEPLSATEAPTTSPEFSAAPSATESPPSEPLAAPPPEQTAPEVGASGPETSTTSEALAMSEPVSEAGAPESTSSSAGSETITVKPGEYLYSIAKRIYGDASKWRLIYDANRDQLSNPDAVWVGMKLVVPAAN